MVRRDNPKSDMQSKASIQWEDERSLSSNENHVSLQDFSTKYSFLGDTGDFWGTRRNKGNHQNSQGQLVTRISIDRI